MATFIGKFFGTEEPAWMMDSGFREDEEEPYYRETISYRNYPVPTSFTCYPEPPRCAHFFEPPMFANYPDAMPYRMFLEPPVIMPRHPSGPPKMVRFREPVEQPRPQEIRRSQPKKVHPEIELRVPMCCSKCEDKVRNELKKVDGVTRVLCDRATQKVTVTGKVDPEVLLKRAKKAKKKAEFFSGTIYSKNFIDFIQSKTVPKQPEVLDVFSSFRHQSSPEMETDTEDLCYDTESSVTFTHPSTSERDTYASHVDSQQSSSYNQFPPSDHERDTYDHNDVRDGGVAYSQYAPAYTCGVTDLHPQPVVSSRPSYGHQSYSDREYIPEYESQGTSYSQYDPSYQRYDSGPYQNHQRSGYGESEDYPHHAPSSSQLYGDSGITNPNYMKQIITDY